MFHFAAQWAFSYLWPLFSDLSRYVKYFRAVVMVSVYLLPSTYQPLDIKGATHKQKYTKINLLRCISNSFKSKQVNIDYISLLPEKGWDLQFLLTDCVAVMEICWLHVGEHEKFVKQPTSRSIHHISVTEQSENVSCRDRQGKGKWGRKIRKEKKMSF